MSDEDEEIERWVVARLIRERNAWKRKHLFGFLAKPMKLENGSLDYRRFECCVPGEKGTMWEGGSYKLMMTFTNKYPFAAPECRFQPPIFHVNVKYPSGVVCASFLGKNWKPTTKITDILCKIQELLNKPDLIEPGEIEAFVLYCFRRSEYERRVLIQSIQMGV